MLSDWAAIAIDNARLYTRLQGRHDELERAVRGLEATAAIARSVGAETDLERVLELVVKRGRALLDARSLVVVLEQDGQARVAAAAGETGEERSGTELATSGTVAGAALERRASERIADLAGRMGHGLGELAAGATSALVAPLAFRAGTRGLLVAFDRLSRRPGVRARRRAPALLVRRQRRDRHRHRAVRGGRAAAQLRRGVRAGAATLGARAPRRDAPGARSAQGAARGRPPRSDRPEAIARRRRPSGRPDPAVDQRAPGPDHRAPPRGARRARDRPGPRRADQAHGGHLGARHPGARRPRLRAGAEPVAARPGAREHDLPARPGVARRT